jgi:hypothetical protein
MSYLNGLHTGILVVLSHEGYNCKKFKMVTRWQLAVEATIIKYAKKNKVGQESTANKKKSVRLPLQQFKDEILKLSKQDQKDIIEDLAVR